MPANTIGKQDLARLIDITPRWISKLTADGVLHRAQDADGKELQGRYTLLSIRDYCRYLKAQSRLDDSSESLKAALTNRRLAADAEMSELKLRLYKGSLHEASDVEFCMTNMLTFFKQRVLAIPARVSRQLIGKRSFREIYDIIMTEIVSCLQELSGYDRNMFAQQRAARLADQGVDLAALNGQSNPTPETTADAAVAD